MKPFWIVGILTVLCGGGWVGLGYLLYDPCDEFSLGPEFDLAKRDNDLVVLKKQTLVKTLQSHRLEKKITASIEIQEKGLGQDLLITAKGKKIRRSMQGVQSFEVAPDSSSICYIESKLAKDVPNEYERTVWIWKEATGFKQLSTSYAHLDNLLYSQDGTKITAAIRDRNSSISTKFLICALDGSGSTTYAFPFDPSAYLIGEASPILINDGWVILLNDKYPRTLCRWNTKNDQIIDINLGGGIVQAINYFGTIWGVRETGRDKYDIVRLSADMNQVEEVIAP